MAVASILAVLSLAAAQPAPAEAAPAVDSDALFQLFERFCLSRGEAPPGFEAVAWSEFPEGLRLMNTYGHAGTFLRSAAPAAIYVAQTRGAAHMNPGIEMRCGVAAQGVNTAPIIERLAAHTRSTPAPPVEMDGTSMTILIGNGGAFTVYRAGDWAIVRSMDMLIALPRQNERGRRGRRGARN